MIIGDGDIASILKGKWFESNDLVIVFASGVSNSKCVDVEEFEREKNFCLTKTKIYTWFIFPLCQFIIRAI